MMLAIRLRPSDSSYCLSLGTFLDVGGWVMSRWRYAILIMVVLAVGSTAQRTAGQTAAKHEHAPARTSTRAGSKTAPPVASSKMELERIKQQLDDQRKDDQRQFDVLAQQNQELEARLKGAEEKMASDENAIKRLTSGEDPQVTELQSEVAAIKSAQSSTSVYIAQEKQHRLEEARPLNWHFKGVDIAPGGFFAAEALYRSHAENAEINTTWSSIPFDSQVMAHLSEFRATARQTRLSLRADGAAGNATMTGYFETDFLGSGSGASEVQTNGYSNRIRQLWGRVQFPTGWTFSAGQMWSLITSNRTGIENLTEFAIPLVDGSQMIGIDYARQTAFRLTKRFDQSKIALAFAAENSATVGVTPSNVPSSVTNLLSGLSTTGTGVLSNTTYSTNVAPDLIAKVAADTRFGHYEVKAIGRTFRDRLDSTATTPGHNNTRLGGAMGGEVYVPFLGGKVNTVAEGMWGAIGRYGSTSTDVVVEPSGQLSVEKSVHALAGIETHPSLKLDWYAFASDEFLPRNYGYGIKTVNNSGCFVEASGTSTAPSCSPNIRNLEGFASGFWYRFYKGPAGIVQYGGDYIYVVKNTWYGVGGAPRGIDNIAETSFRYYLP